MKSHARPHDSPHRREAGRGKSWRDYLPLLVLLAATALAASAKHHAYGPMADTATSMHDFMGFFLVLDCGYKR